MNAFPFLSLNNMKHENLHGKIACQVHGGCFPPGKDEKEGGGEFSRFLNIKTSEEKKIKALGTRFSMVA